MTLFPSVENQLDKQGVKYEPFRTMINDGRTGNRAYLKALKVRANEKKVTIQIEGKFDMKITGVQWLVLDSRYGGVYSIENFDRYFTNTRAN